VDFKTRASKIFLLIPSWLVSTPAEPQTLKTMSDLSAVPPLVNIIAAYLPEHERRLVSKTFQISLHESSLFLAHAGSWQEMLHLYAQDALREVTLMFAPIDLTSFRGCRLDRLAMPTILDVAGFSALHVKHLILSATDSSCLVVLRNPTTNALSVRSSLPLLDVYSPLLPQLRSLALHNFVITRLANLPALKNLEMVQCEVRLLDLPTLTSLSLSRCVCEPSSWHLPGLTCFSQVGLPLTSLDALIGLRLRAVTIASDLVTDDFLANLQLDFVDLTSSQLSARVLDFLQNCAVIKLRCANLRGLTPTSLPRCHTFVLDRCRADPDVLARLTFAARLDCFGLFQPRWSEVRGTGTFGTRLSTLNMLDEELDGPFTLSKRRRVRWRLSLFQVIYLRFTRAAVCTAAVVTGGSFVLHFALTAGIFCRRRLNQVAWLSPLLSPLLLAVLPWLAQVQFRGSIPRLSGLYFYAGLGLPVPRTVALGYLVQTVTPPLMFGAAVTGFLEGLYNGYLDVNYWLLHMRAEKAIGVMSALDPAAIPACRELSITNRQLCKEDIAHIARLRPESVSLSGCTFQGGLGDLEDLYALPFRRLDLSHTHMTNSVLQKFTPAAVDLNLRNTFIDNACNLARWTNLRTLDVRETGVTDPRFLQELNVERVLFERLGTAHTIRARIGQLSFREFALASAFPWCSRSRLPAVSRRQT
jgi:hypothetical protein